MAVITIQHINKILTGKNQKYVSLDIKTDDNVSRNVVYATDNSDNNTNLEDKKDAHNNTHSIISNDKNIIIRSLFDVKDLCVKSNVQNDYNSTLDVYAPSLDNNPIQISKLDNSTYILTPPVDKTALFNVSNLERKHLDNTNIVEDLTYNLELSGKNYKPSLYNPIINDNVISANWKVDNNINAIKNNVVLELQNSSRWNNYEEGEVHGDFITCKCAYNSNYSMDMQDNGEKLKTTRHYDGLDVCANTVFMKFTDVNETGKCENLPYQKIETIGGNDTNTGKINRLDNNIIHKSNLYSLNIKNTKLNSINTENENLKQLKSNIIQDLTNNISDIAKKLCPVDSQLFEVNFV